MKENSLVSIAMCTYNGEKFIKEQLDTIINQSYKNLEIIITQNSITIDSITMSGLELNLSDVVTNNNQRTANINIPNVIGDIVITGRANYPV